MNTRSLHRVGAMSSQRYQRVCHKRPARFSPFPSQHPTVQHPQTANQSPSQVAADDTDNHGGVQSSAGIPQSPPPSFRSQVSSRRSSRDEAHHNTEERDLDNAFDAPSDDEDADDDDDREGRGDQQRLISSNATAPSTTEASSAQRPTEPERRDTEIPTFTTAAPSGRVMGGGSRVNDGVWANLSAKPQAGEDLDEKPPVRTFQPVRQRNFH